MRPTPLARALGLACAGLILLPTAARAQTGPAVASPAAASAPASAASAPAAAASAPAPTQRRDLALPEVRATAPRESMGSTVLRAEQIGGTPGGNGDLTSVLRRLPGVQFDNSQLSSSTLGEIAPANISINGAKFYDNLFLLDGASITNYIDPGNSNPAANRNPSLGNSLGLAIDTSLLCRLQLMDSNIGAEYGGFSGGVVLAETCAPRQRLGGEVSVEHSSSNWTQYKIHPGQRTALEQSASASLQPAFDKWFYRAMLEGRPSDRLGLRLSLADKRSEIPLAGYASGLQSATDANRKVQTREEQSLLLSGWWTPSADVKARFSLAHEPSTGRYFIQNARDSYYETVGGGQQASADLTHPLGRHLVLRHDVEASTMQTSRDAQSNIWKLWRYSAADKNWGNPTGNVSEGGYGDVDQTQSTLGYRVKAEARPLHWGAVRHALSGGLSLQHTRFRYERLEDYEQYGSATATSTCALAAGGTDTTLCSMATPYNASSGGQFLASRIVYKAGRFDLDNDRLALYLQDELSLGRWRLRLGARAEHDDLAAETAFAPRLAAFWDMQGNGRSELEVGANRYHSRNFFRYFSNRESLALQSSSQTRRLSGGQIGAWADPVFGSTAAMYNLGELKLPYQDELMLGLRQVTGPLTWTVKYVDRRGEDEVVLHLRSAGNYWWDNVGHSRAKVWTLQAGTTQALAWAGTQTQFALGLDVTRVNSSHADYDDTLNSNAGELEKIISWNGQFIRYIDRPADNYVRPWTLKLSTSTVIPDWHLTLDTLLNVRDSYEKMSLSDTQVDYNGTLVDAYTRQRYRKAVTVDLRAQWALPVAAGQQLLLALSIENLFNRSNVIEATSTTTSYEKGRQAWLRVGYRF